MVSARSSPVGSKSDSPILYKDMFVKLPNQHPTPTQQFCDLSSALADHIAHNIGNPAIHKLTPDKMAEFYRLVSDSDRWDGFWLNTPGSALSEILSTIGAFHSLEPTEDAYKPPCIPTLTRAGFVRWISLQLLLSPECHVKFMQYAVQNFQLKHPFTGQVFPRNLPSVVFPLEPDQEVVEWHSRCGDHLRDRFERERRNSDPGVDSPLQDGASPKESFPSKRSDRGRGREPSASFSPKTTNPAATAEAAVAAAAAAAAATATATAAATAAGASSRPHTRSTSASLPRESTTKRDPDDPRFRPHLYTNMHSSERNGSERETDSPTSGTRYSHTSPKTYTSGSGTRADRMHSSRDHTDREYEYSRDRASADSRRRAPSPDGPARPMRKRPQMLRHLSANMAVPRAPFSPSSPGFRASFASDNEGSTMGSSATSPRSPMYPPRQPRRRSEHLARDATSPGGHSTTSTSSTGSSGIAPHIRLSVDPPSSRFVPFIVSPASPRGRPPYHFDRSSTPISDEKEAMYANMHTTSHSSGSVGSTKRRSVYGPIESLLNMFSSGGSDRAASRESSRDRDGSRMRDRERRANSREHSGRHSRIHSRQPTVSRDVEGMESDISEEDEQTPTKAGFRHVHHERDRERDRDGERDWDRREHKVRGGRYDDEPRPPPRTSATRVATESKRSKSHADMERPRQRASGLHY